LQYRIDRKTGNKLSVLGFGCMHFPRTLGRIDLQKTDELVMRSIERGVNFFDTAWIYPGSEETLGTIVYNNRIRDKVYIATKLPLIMARKPEDFNRFFDQSIERLKTDYIDYYLMHMITDLDQWQRLKNWGIEDWIAQKKKSGRVKQIGFSFHGQVSEFLKVIDDYDWDICLIQYNYSNENYQAGVTGLRAAAEKMPVVIMEPLLGGKLATGLPKEAVKIFNNANANLQANTNLQPAGWAFNWIWDQKEVTTVLSGMSSIEQLDENAGYADVSSEGMLNDTHKVVYKSVLSYVNRSFKIHCTGCNYCMPCPAGVNIPGSFSAYNTVYSLGYVEGMKQYVTSTGFTQIKSGSPDLCTECGVCETHCPQKLPVMKDLVTVLKRMEPLFIRLLGVCARAFLGKKRKTSK